MAAECDETAANLYCVDHSLTGSKTPIEARCHEITKLLEEWKDGHESARAQFAPSDTFYRNIAPA